MAAKLLAADIDGVLEAAAAQLRDRVPQFRADFQKLDGVRIGPAPRMAGLICDRIDGARVGEEVSGRAGYIGKFHFKDLFRWR